jgi:hypothetical protein
MDTTPRARYYYGGGGCYSYPRYYSSYGGCGYGGYYGYLPRLSVVLLLLKVSEFEA